MKKNKYSRPACEVVIMGAEPLMTLVGSGNPGGGGPSIGNGGANNGDGEGNIPEPDVRGEYRPKLHIGLGEEW